MCRVTCYQDGMGNDCSHALEGYPSSTGGFGRESRNQETETVWLGQVMVMRTLAGGTATGVDVRDRTAAPAT